ncbi:ribonuclease P protein component [bacterium]|jgi:ribonuclease P protein component|nr:ribonuclease P protein component [bacterium]MBT4251037.1 ribonuclease P protein component [bacterium]MBT4597942.1 ribonuclease P protein component [bacterium]MBT6753489.1 ribonuclease P protein component [bacterium]MBT7037209.1 ribonuclease P protein component [bacterium]
MLPLENRLKNSSEIKKVFEGGKSARNDFLFLRFNCNNSQYSRIAFSVGLNHSKSAVKRNRTKRLLRVAAKQLLDRIKPGFDIVIYIKNVTPENVEGEKITHCLKKALAFAKILKQ